MIKLQTFLGPALRTNSPEVRFCCPFCPRKSKKQTPDTEYKLYLNSRNGFFFCQRCESKGHVSRLTPDLSEPEDWATKRDKIFKKLNGTSREDQADDKASPAPEDYVPVSEWPDSEAVDYLAHRGIPFELACKRRIGFGTRELRGRVIFPVFDPKDPNQWVYWVARSYQTRGHRPDCKCWFCIVRYQNAATPRKYHLYGLTYVQGDTVCVAEGPISAENCGPDSVAALGKYVTEEQVDLLSRFKCVQVALDDDAIQQSWSLLCRLMLKGVEVHWIPFPAGKDPADLGIPAMQVRRQQAIPITRWRHPLICQRMKGVE